MSVPTILLRCGKFITRLTSRIERPASGKNHCPGSVSRKVCLKLPPVLIISENERRGEERIAKERKREKSTPSQKCFHRCD